MNPDFCEGKISEIKASSNFSMALDKFGRVFKFIKI